MGLALSRLHFIRPEYPESWQAQAYFVFAILAPPRCVKILTYRLGFLSFGRSPGEILKFGRGISCRRSRGSYLLTICNDDAKGDGRLSQFLAIFWLGVRITKPT